MGAISLLGLLMFSGLFVAQNQGSFVLVLGITQDGGYPHPKCNSTCCETAWQTQYVSKKNLSFLTSINGESGTKVFADEVNRVDVVFLDATFYQADELPGRDIREVPHPFVSETIQLFAEPDQKRKIQFIHFNHTNPLLWNEKA